MSLSFGLRHRNCYSFQIIGSRLGFDYSRDGIMWNWPPGALVSLPSFSDTLKHFPFYTHMLGTRAGDSLTAVIYITRGGLLTATNPLYKLVKNISKSQFVSRVIITITIIIIVVVVVVFYFLPKS